MYRTKFRLFKGGGAWLSGARALVASVVALALVALALVALALVAPAQALAQALSASIAGVQSVTVFSERQNVVDVTFAGDVQGRITFLDDGIFRYNVDPTGEFSAYATPRDESHVAKIQAQLDTSDTYSKPAASVSETDDAFQISAGSVTVVLEKATGRLSIMAGERVVMQESAPLEIGSDKTVQHVAKVEGESFFGGGTQNGRFNHTGKTINIANEGSWVDGGVASPNPFYWSSEGYGVLRNTFADGSYDFGASDSASVAATHEEAEFEAYYFVTSSVTMSDVAQDIL